MTIIKNVKVCKDNELIDMSVVTEGHLIKEVLPKNKIIAEEYSEEAIFDGNGGLLIPGMIDVHIHGAKNYDMMDGSTESIQAVSMACAETGCTSFLVTSVSSSLEDLIQMIRQTKKVIGKEKGAKIAGIHLEGPYLNIEKKGMQNPAHLRHPDLKEMKKIFDEADGLIKMVTIAPELPGGIEIIDFLKKRGVVVAIAHSNATYEEAQDAFEKGASHITHCFNAMPAIHHRAPGLVAAALENDSISVQAIVDGVHLHPGIVRLIHKIKGPDKMVLTTDALQAMGVGDGEYIFGGHQVTVTEGVARLQDGTLASSTVTMNKSLRLSNEFGINLQDTIQMATSTPADILGMKNLGRIEKGYSADLVLLDKKFEVLSTWINGEKY
ncbi:N-acetylglucosamine-6-phosphate deacetylase [Listeria monocytogenes]|uniref:N-acetylglucosamine-6-phosphate deacetylase n=1 Tax=Listeria monocytogenes TaxID=1639 RepID=UPI00053BFDD5|nr:N-acetylglucosamine-6-phosphate deacetylase [Listeria monocytogenes]EAA0166316.1 N-acetylglucosamine-6-phosphate deacetylase [Listeria monocytogenes serotype 1/2a]AKI50106.1 N-acetylglucosamine-6-phosphate deacetylase [Listeria monocytogenes]ARJ89194.1 N-acetylglucosamine-6-phosphate deacetylase [Listeria monocytogenes]EAC2782744.1 N-acetylglucosamine-6-phosphate deacetylase [Listeria monocytogenes]EAC3043122.1 N-acetylglucosamine-6-phosphate deacetylase [Listeria monocytogenes]